METLPAGVVSQGAGYWGATEPQSKKRNMGWGHSGLNCVLHSLPKETSVTPNLCYMRLWLCGGIRVVHMDLRVDSLSITRIHIRRGNWDKNISQGKAVKRQRGKNGLWRTSHSSHQKLIHLPSCGQSGKIPLQWFPEGWYFFHLGYKFLD